jgi:hypothetical protein
MSGGAVVKGEAMEPKKPSDLHPALTEPRLAVAARLLVQGRSDALARAEPDSGDDAWSIGCRAYSFSRHQVRRAALSGRYPWLKVLDATQHFVFLIDGVPIRFYRGPADDPSTRTLIQHEIEAQQISLAFGENGDTGGLLFRLAIETGDDGEVKRVVFLAVRDDETVCFWPVPLVQSAEVIKLPSRAKTRHSAGDSQLALPIAVG